MGVEEECETKLAGGVLSAFVQGGVEAGGGVCVRGGGVGWSRSSYVSFSSWYFLEFILEEATAS